MYEADVVQSSYNLLVGVLSASAAFHVELSREKSGLASYF